MQEFGVKECRSRAPWILRARVGLRLGCGTCASKTQISEVRCEVVRESSERLRWRNVLSLSDADNARRVAIAVSEREREKVSCGLWPARIKVVSDEM